MTPGKWCAGHHDEGSYVSGGLLFGGQQIATLSYKRNPHDHEDSEAIARTRNALREMAEQLMAAVQEVERLTNLNVLAQDLEVRRVNMLSKAQDAVFAWRNWSDEVAPPWGSAEDRTDEGQRKKITADLSSLRASCEQLTRERDEERKEVLVLRHLVKLIDETLRVPAAEYVPAISDVFSLIDALSSTHQAGTK